MIKTKTMFQYSNLVKYILIPIMQLAVLIWIAYLTYGLLTNGDLANCLNLADKIRNGEKVVNKVVCKSVFRDSFNLTILSIFFLSIQLSNLSNLKYVHKLKYSFGVIGKYARSNITVFEYLFFMQILISFLVRRSFGLASQTILVLLILTFAILGISSINLPLKGYLKIIGYSFIFLTLNFLIFNFIIYAT